MKKPIETKQFKFYLFVGLGLLGLMLLSDLAAHRETFFRRALNDCWVISFVIVLNYYFFERVLPKLSGREAFKSLFRILGYSFLYFLGIHLWHWIGTALNIYTELNSYPSESHAVAAQMGFAMMSLFFFGIVRHIYIYNRLKQSAQQLLIQKQQAELNYLKSQTNPHFLFNTLNNIYSLARDRSDLAPESILRLSKILRYMLYETAGDYIAIEQELRIISDYIALEKLRYDETLRVNFNNDIEDMKQAMPPLLLVPLVENAFKHGVSETRNQPFVDIHLSVNRRQLKFVVKNSCEGLPPDRRVKENIGLSNLRRQLELLYTEYDLSVQQGESVFTATLKINLASHV